jgi:hypothetical protein
MCGYVFLHTWGQGGRSNIVFFVAIFFLCNLPLVNIIKMILITKMFWGHFNNLLRVVMVSHCVVPDHHLFRHFWDLSRHYFSFDDVFFQRVNLEHNIVDHPINCTSLLCHIFSFLPERTFHRTSPYHNTTLLSLQKTKKIYKIDIYKLYNTTNTKSTKKIYKFNICKLYNTIPTIYKIF